MCQNEKVRKIFAWKLFYIHILDEKTVQNAILSTVWHFISIKNFHCYVSLKF